MGRKELPQYMANGGLIMDQKQIIVPVGLPGSGKTSYIEKHRKRHTETSVIISGDELRLMLNLGVYRFSMSDTKLIIRAMIDMAKTMLLHYDTVYLDEYYICYTEKAREYLTRQLGDHGTVEFIHIPCDLGQCIYRRIIDHREGDTSRWPNVLLHMMKDFEPISKETID